jgi:thiosulfate dehydrogenase [quinone] large subunit
MKSKINYNYSNIQLFWLVTLRVFIGWYFLYEGLAKVLSPKWTAYGYLMDSKGLFAPLFRMIAENPDLMAIADFINIWGLTLIGLLLILGLFEKAGYIGAALLLTLYYLSHPPLLNVAYLLRPEGSYLWVDKNLIMLAATIVLLYFPTSGIIGLDSIMNKKFKKR